MNEDFDSFRESVTHAVKEMADQFNALRDELINHKQTVNRALNLLSKELLDFTTHDVVERKQRQRRQDYKDVAIGCFLLLTVLAACSIISVQVYLLYR